MADEQAKDTKVTCIRCFRLTQKLNEFCGRCGAPLHNRCSDEPGLLDKGCSHVNTSDAAYCIKCGQPTTFLKAGLVDGYFHHDS